MKKREIIISISLIIVLGLLIGLIVYKKHIIDLKNREIEKQKQEEKLLKKIKDSYNDYVSTNKDSKLYLLENNKYKEIGTISKDTIINLEATDITLETKYFKIVGLDSDYYISYEDIVKTEAKEKNKRYLNYIKLDKQIITKDKTNFYLNDKLIYSIDKSFTFPIYMIDNDKYYIEYDGNLMYVLKDDIKEIKDVKNNDEYAKEMAVIVYHFVYDSSKNEECNQSICHSVTQFNSHLDYIKNNNFFTPTMHEFELFMDGKIKLPKKSVMITIDDGWYAHNASRLLTEHKLNGTVFLITKSYEKEYVATEYVEAHSHTHDMHNPGICPGGQGGGIKCLSKSVILNDLKTSSEKLGGSKALCYPFYEYNDYSISVLKEAGYTLGFAGYMANGTIKARVGADKYKIPRVTMVNNSSVEYLASIIN